MEKHTKKRSRLYRATHLQENCDPLINIAVFSLMIFGTLMIVSTSVGMINETYTVVGSVFRKQILFLMAGYIAMLLVNKVFNFRWFYKVQWMFFVIFCGVLLLPFAFVEVGGSHAWIQLGPITVQPSEFAKPFIIILIATALYIAQKKPNRWQSFKTLFKGPVIAFIIIEIIVVFQKDIGTATIIAVIAFACAMIPSHPNIEKTQRMFKKWVIILIAIAILGFGFTNIGTRVLKHTPLAHIATRIENAKNPFRPETIFDDGYQPANSLYGIADSGVWGKGIGNSSRKYGYLTQADNDYILAITIEETGIFGFGFIIIMYGLIIYRLLLYAFKTNNLAYKVVLSGNATYLFIHFVLNVGGVGAMIPMTGIPLLFISSGGSSLLAICAMIGVSQQCIHNIRSEELKG